MAASDVAAESGKHSEQKEIEEKSAQQNDDATRPTSSKPKQFREKPQRGGNQSKKDSSGQGQGQGKYRKKQQDAAQGQDGQQLQSKQDGNKKVDYGIAENAESAQNKDKNVAFEMKSDQSMKDEQQKPSGNNNQNSRKEHKKGKKPPAKK